MQLLDQLFDRPALNLTPLHPSPLPNRQAPFFHTPYPIMADSGAKKPTGALNVERRTWDVEHFEKLAKEKLERVRVEILCMRTRVCWLMHNQRVLPSRLTHHTHQPQTPYAPQQAAGQDAGGKPKPGFVRKREEFQSADSGAAGPEGSKRAFLKAREQDLRLDEKVNKVQVRIWGVC